MTELSFSHTSNKKNNELFSNMFNLCFSVFSHPLYFSYFLFFSPYLFRLLSFLSPLFITTTLLLLVALLTFTPNLLVQEKVGGSEISESRWNFLHSVFQTHVAWLLSKADDNKDEEIGCLAEFEAYLVMFQASIFEVFDPKPVEDGSEEVSEAPHDVCSCEGRQVFGSIMEERVVNTEGNKVEKTDTVEATLLVAEIKTLEILFQQNSELVEDASCQKEKKEEKEVDTETNKVEESERRWSLRNGSKVSDSVDSDHGAALLKVKKSQQLEATPGSPESNWGYSERVIGNNINNFNNLGSFGSMRVEKEWRRTLACKLFEERHNANGSDGMDMLWETYETESNKVVLQKSNTKKTKKADIECRVEEDDDEHEDEMEGKLCCLQALKFSAGKINLGMGRPNFVKFSKALKGIGWFHHVGKHGRKDVIISHLPFNGD
ncbi:hypothetical protein Ahy_Scaffold2g107599 isoform A [Arachis hypogaea]|uniref:Uncharacterized protein n=1 Tax=Arachis hypogaea TaxID=3818 RepID=A0A444WQE9_ARAHY|nr:hypothetical protein Ahy_Scaffold2g107599 isoform A [Arachis hypogaea]